MQITAHNWLRLVFMCALTGLCVSTPAQTRGFTTERDMMVDQQIKARGIKHEATLQAMRKVERHRFVPIAGQGMAYEDRPVPIGYGQTISQPFIVAYMTEIIEPGKGQKILEIGTGSGYQAAVLAEIVDSVYTVEIVRELYVQAVQRLRDLEYENIRVKYDDGYHGWADKGPFDAIVVTAAAEFIPPPLIAQLKEGGKMIIPVGSPFLVQWLMLVGKEKGKVKTTKLMPVRFVPFTRVNE